VSLIGGESTNNKQIRISISEIPDKRINPITSL